jgi:hypothetical protein
MANDKVKKRHVVELQIDAECEAVRGLRPATNFAETDALFEYAVYVAIASRVWITLSELTTLFSDVSRERVDHAIDRLAATDRIDQRARCKGGIVYSLPRREEISAAP